MKRCAHEMDSSGKECRRPINKVTRLQRGFGDQKSTDSERTCAVDCEDPFVCECVWILWWGR